MPSYPRQRVVAAWLVHIYTGLGLPLNFLAVQAIYLRRDFATFCFLNWIAVLVDATDGTLARSVDVKRVVPGFDGALLDNIVDFLTFAFVPALGISAFELVPSRTLQAVLSSCSLFASGFQFCQSVAKTNEAFVGFPSYWNVVFFYEYLLKLPAIVTTVAYVSCTVLSFVPLHFVYPSRTKFMKTTTLTLGSVWATMMVVPVLFPRWPYALLVLRLSLLYVVYYVLLSAYLQFRRPESPPESKRPTD